MLDGTALMAKRTVITSYSIHYTKLYDLINGTRDGYRALENLSDLLDVMTSGYHTGSVTASSNSWHKMPSAEIRKIWTYLENVDHVPDMTSEEKNLRKAEVKVLLAYHRNNFV